MNTKSQNNKHTIRNLAIFTFLVIALGWLGRWVDAVMGSTSSEGIGMLIWIIAPLGVSFLLRAFAGFSVLDYENHVTLLLYKFLPPSRRPVQVLCEDYLFVK